MSIFRGKKTQKVPEVVLVSIKDLPLFRAIVRPARLSLALIQYTSFFRNEQDVSEQLSIMSALCIVLGRWRLKMVLLRVGERLYNDLVGDIIMAEHTVGEHTRICIREERNVWQKRFRRRCYGQEKTGSISGRKKETRKRG